VPPAIEAMELAVRQLYHRDPSAEGPREASSHPGSAKGSVIHETEFACIMATAL